MDSLLEKLARESVYSTVGSAIYCGELAEVLRKCMKAAEVNNVKDMYGEEGDPIRDEYVERDKQVLQYMRKYPEIRKIVEEWIGEPITAIWKDAEV